MSCPLPADCVNAVVLLNVLEHIADDNRALAEVYRILKPGGVAVIEVPAGPHLLDIYDRLVMHFRRYTLRDIKGKVVQAGFGIVMASHLGFLPYPAFRWAKWKNRKLAAADEDTMRRSVSADMQRTRRSRLLAVLMKAESLLDRVMPFPWGIRCVVTGKKLGT